MYGTLCEVLPTNTMDASACITLVPREKLLLAM